MTFFNLVANLINLFDRKIMTLAYLAFTWIKTIGQDVVFHKIGGLEPTTSLKIKSEID